MDPSSITQQEISNQALETIILCSESNSKNNDMNLQDQQKKPKPQPEHALKCPRCDSINTKFCYYNNYSLSQPRYFCKSCRRYWTKGGTLRNVPVGGGCRKNRRSSTSSVNSISKNKPFHDDVEPFNNPLITGFPSLSYDAIDLNLAFATLHQKQQSSSSLFGSTELSIFGNSESTHRDIFGNSCGGIFGGQNGNFRNELGYEFVMGGGDHGHLRSNNITTTSSSMATPLEELSNSKQEDPNNDKILWGFPWQMTGEVAVRGVGGGGPPEIETGRKSWKGFGSSWHGLLNSPLI